MSLPLVTRFGADPLLDLEVANKQYVDNNTGSGFFILGARHNGYTTNSNVFGTIFSNNTRVATESQMTAQIFQGFTVIRNGIHILTNSKGAGDTLYSFRDDGSDIGLLTIAFGTSGLFDSGALTDVVAGGSLIVYRYDTSGQSSGTLSINPNYTECTT